MPITDEIKKIADTQLNRFRLQQKGFHVAIEGIDGSGKTTLVDSLATRMTYLISGFNGKPLCIRQPGGSEYAESVRNIARRAEVDSFTQTLVYASAIYDSYTTKAIPYLKGDGIVLSDRFFNTLFAYQGLYGKTSALVVSILREIHKYRTPDLTLYLSMPLQESLNRTNARGKEQDDDRYSAQALDKKRKLKAYYDLLHGVEGEDVKVLTTEEYQWAKIAIAQYRGVDYRTAQGQPESSIVILDASKSADKVLADAYTAITTEMENRL